MFITTHKMAEEDMYVLKNIVDDVGTIMTQKEDVTFNLLNIKIKLHIDW